MKSLGDRMKEYEGAYRLYLPRRLPIIIRVDGRAFHTFTKNCERPFDPTLAGAMLETAKNLCEEIDFCKVAYTQSDEISLLLINYDTLEAEPWFGNNVQKIVSNSAAMASVFFNKNFIHNNKPAIFDSRVFILPQEEVCNYFLERQWDAIRNSINGLGQKHFSHKELQKLNTDQVQEKLFQEKHINWNECSVWQKQGACIHKKDRDWIINFDIPKFSQDRSYINQYVYQQDNKS